MLETAAPEASYEKIKGRILKNQGFCGFEKVLLDSGYWGMDDRYLMMGD